MTAGQKRAAFAASLAGERIILAPGVYDLVTARIADQAGFAALYMTGYGVSASLLGLPDAGLATYTDMAGRVAAISGATGTPLIADGDTGYGGLLNVAHTVRGYETAGACVIQLEDQEFPKKCGHTPGRRVIPGAEMVARIKVAVDARAEPDFLIMARTDARTGHGLDEALRRAEAYAKAGADILFVESPESEEEMRRIAEATDLPLVVNMVEGGRTPLLPASDLQEMGYKIALFPVAVLLGAAEAARRLYAGIKEAGSTAGAGVPLFDFDAFSRLMGFEEVWAFEEKWADEDEG